MRVLIAPDQLGVLRAALQRAGTNEIGGQLYGRQLMPSHFVVTDVTVQQQAGTFARFVVDLVQAARDALRFFTRTDHRYTRFNYLGEWHSHPSFEVVPSQVDRQAMQDIVRDSTFRGTFAMLIIVRLDQATVTCGGWIFDPSGHEEPVTIEAANEPAEKTHSD